MTKEELKTQYAPLFAEIFEEGRQAAAADAIVAERERVASILTVPATGHGALVETALKDGSSAERLAFQILTAEKAQREAHLANSAAASQTVPSGEASAPGTDETRSLIAAAVSGGSIKAD